MKKLIVTLFCLLSIGLIQAQDFENKGNYAIAGVGLDPYYTPLNGGLGLGPFKLGYERGITEVIGIGRIGVGGSVSYSYYSGTHEGFEDRGTRVSIFARGTYHFEFNVPKMDVYAGVGVGTQSVNFNHHPSSLTSGHHVFAGIRYFFKPTLGVYGEFGHGSSALNGGLVMSF